MVGSPMLRLQVQMLRLRPDAPWPSELAKARRQMHRFVLVKPDFYPPSHTRTVGVKKHSDRAPATKQKGPGFCQALCVSGTPDQRDATISAADDLYVTRPQTW